MAFRPQRAVSQHEMKTTNTKGTFRNSILVTVETFIKVSDYYCYFSGRLCVKKQLKTDAFKRNHQFR